MPDQPICILVPEVIGVGECQVVLLAAVSLSHSGNEIKRVTKTVTVDDVVIDHGKVLINGTVHKNVEYERTDHLIGSDNFNVPFDCCISVPGAVHGDQFQLESQKVCVESDVIVTPPSTELLEKFCVHIVGKVTRNVQITVAPVTPSVCPPVPLACD